jgi:hypothetical protein
LGQRLSANVRFGKLFLNNFILINKVRIQTWLKVNSNVKKVGEKEVEGPPKRQASRPASPTENLLVRQNGVAAAKSPIHCCDISAACIDGSGMGPVAIIRALPSGQFATVIFLIDSFCLGVKNVTVTIRTKLELDELLEGLQKHNKMEPVTAGVARGYVEAAIAYAAALGFQPHDDYRKAKPIWGTIDPESIPEHYQFGQHGKPHFMTFEGSVTQQLNDRE